MAVSNTWRMCFRRIRLSQKCEGYFDEELFDDVIEQQKAEADWLSFRVLVRFPWRMNSVISSDKLSLH